MPRPRSSASLTLGILLFSACSNDSSPTNPEPAAPLTAVATAIPLASNTWAPRASMPGPSQGFAVGAAPTSAGEWIVYTFGGHDPDDDCISPGALAAYHVDDNTWSFGVDAQARTSDPNGVARIGGRLYFSGGAYSCGVDLRTFNSLWAYVPRTNRLLELAAMPRATKYGVSGAINGKLYVLAGYCTGELDSPGHCVVGSAVRQFYRYDPPTNTWVFRRYPPHFHTLGAAGVIDDKFYVVGGSQGPELDVYDPATNTWQTRAPFPVVSDRYAAAVLGNNLFVVAWSYDGTRTAYAYSPATNTWRRRAVPPAVSEGIVRVVLDGQPRIFLPAYGASYLYTP